MNTYKNTVSGKRAKATRFLELLDIGYYLSYEKVFGNLAFLLFGVVLAMFYIWNSHQTEKMIREMNKMNKDLKELRWEYMSKKSELMFRSKQSEVARSVAPLGIMELRTPPKKIQVFPK